MNDGYIKIHRKIISDWEWYSNINDTRLWFHCLLKANWKDGYFEGQIIPRGSFVCSYGNLAKEVGLSVHQVRTSLNHLILTNNVAIKTTNKFSIISILNYEKYQCDDTQNDKQVANKWQTSGKQVATIEESKKEKKKENNIYKYYGNFKRVKLTDDEYARLVSDYDEEFVINQIALLDEYIESNNNKNKYTNFNLVLRKSIREQWFKPKSKVPEWYDKNTEKKQDTEKLGELEDILKEFE